MKTKLRSKNAKTFNGTR